MEVSGNCLNCWCSCMPGGFHAFSVGLCQQAFELSSSLVFSKSLLVFVRYKGIFSVFDLVV